MNIQLPNGKTVNVSVIDFLSLSDDETTLFYQELIAEDAGEFLDNPFSQIRTSSDLSLDEEDTN